VKNVIFFNKKRKKKKKNAISWSQPANAGMHSCTYPERVKSYHHWKHIQNLISSRYYYLVWMLLHPQNIIKASVDWPSSSSLELETKRSCRGQDLERKGCVGVTVIFILSINLWIGLLVCRDTLSESTNPLDRLHDVEYRLSWLTNPLNRLGSVRGCITMINQPPVQTWWWQWMFCYD
jgi:hypothetical protein